MLKIFGGKDNICFKNIVAFSSSKKTLFGDRAEYVNDQGNAVKCRFVLFPTALAER